MTPKQFDKLIEGYLAKQQDAWKRARLISFYACAAHVKEINSLNDIMSFDDDEIDWTEDELKGELPQFINKLQLKEDKNPNGVK